MKMVKEQKVIDRSLQIIGLCTLKTYVFDSAGDVGEAIKYLKGLYPRYRFCERGPYGVAFLYGYNGTKGADIMVYRNMVDENAMIHTWSIEDGRTLDRNRDGTACETEILIMAREIELKRRKRTNYSYDWPDVSEFLK